MSMHNNKITTSPAVFTRHPLTVALALALVGGFAGKAHAIVLVIDAEKQIISCQMHDAAFKMPASTAGSNNKFDATTFTKTRIAGKAYTVKPDTFGSKDVPFEFSVTFDAPVRAK